MYLFDFTFLRSAMAPGTPSTPKQCKQFQKGDRVFAKVRGYPAWPARVEGIAQKSPNPKNMRYDIFFFGTYQTGKCAGDQLWSFEENREKLGTPKSNKGFKEAMDEITNNPKLPIPTADASDSEHEEQEDTQSEPSPPKAVQKRPSASTPKVAAPKKKVKKSDTSSKPEKTEKPAAKAGLTVAYPFKTRKEKPVTPEKKVIKSKPEENSEDTSDKEEDVEESTSIEPSSPEVKESALPVKKDAPSPTKFVPIIDPSSVKQKEEGAVEVKLTRSQIIQLLGHQGLPDTLRAKLENHVNIKDDAAKK
ncbi:hypothetical protein B566_EDAN006004 [Ephemera danica]|nr:hypothetical protein B566_EDAN006004 [Ephemera danica]